MIEDTNVSNQLELDLTNPTDIVPQNVSWPENFRNTFIKVFTDLPTQHGTYFDNGTRWCEGCQATRLPAKVEKTSPWSKKACLTCEMIWPEYEYEFQWLLRNDPDFLDDIDLTVVTPLDLN